MATSNDDRPPVDRRGRSSTAVLVSTAGILLGIMVAFTVRGIRLAFWSDVVVFAVLALVMVAVIVDTVWRQLRTRRDQREQRRRRMLRAL